MEENRPIVMTKDGLYARDAGLITKNLEQPGISSKPKTKKKSEEPTPLKSRGEALEKLEESVEEDVGKVSRFDCVHKLKEK